MNLFFYFLVTTIFKCTNNLKTTIKKIIFIIGVSGCGKSTIGKLLSKKTTIPFFDGDDFHPPFNIEKMASGKALNDNDRKQWLINLNKHAIKHSQLHGAIIACSALKEIYRKSLMQTINENTEWVHLVGSKETIAARMASRKDHFMPLELLQSQFDTLENPDYGLNISINKNPTEIVEEITTTFNL